LLDVKKDYPWIENVISHIERQGYMAYMRANISGDKARFHLKPAVLTGLHGMGKSTVLISILEALNIPFNVISMSGMADNMMFRGLPKGWGGAHASFIVERVAESGFMNPVFILDEIDKVPPGTHNGNALNSLLQMIEPSSAYCLYDEYLTMSYNGEHVTYLCTANNLNHIPDALRSRLQNIGIGAVRVEHVDAIIRSIVKKAMRDSLGVPLHAIVGGETGLRFDSRFVQHTDSSWISWMRDTLLSLASTDHPEHARLTDIVLNKNIRQARKMVDIIIEFECMHKSLPETKEDLNTSTSISRLH
jgi:hypothetical protein